MTPTPTEASGLVPSPATDAVLAADQPSPEHGPCATCAFRPGTVPNQSLHTMALARHCVEGIVPFHCHEHKRLCRGWIAAVNVRGAPLDDDDRKWRDVNALAADILGDAIEAGKKADDAALAAMGGGGQ